MKEEDQNDEPYVCIRRCIFVSAGWGIEYPQNSTEGLKKSRISHALDEVGV